MTKTLLKTLAAAIAAVCALAGCKTEYEALLESSDTDLKYAAAFKYFEAGNYNRAGQLFESLSVITTGTERDDTIQFYWGMCNYRQRDFITAEANFKKFIENYPRSAFAEQAEFFHIDCLFRGTLRYELDQTPTYAAITGISQYIINHPESSNVPVCKHMLEDLEERLDRKAYENAKLYYRMEDYKAARVALRNVLKDDADNLYREEILYLTAMSSYKYADLSIPERRKERFLIFVDDYLNFVGEYPGSSHRPELDRLYRAVRKK